MTSKLTREWLQHQISEIEVAGINDSNTLAAFKIALAAMLTGSGAVKLVNDVTTGKPLTITLPDISSKAFWSGAGKTEVFHPETYKRWVKEAIERHCAIARIDVEVK